MCCVLHPNKNSRRSFFRSQVHSFSSKFYPFVLFDFGYRVVLVSSVFYLINPITFAQFEKSLFCLPNNIWALFFGG